jgi:hypothetical protein
MAMVDANAGLKDVEFEWMIKRLKKMQDINKKLRKEKEKLERKYNKKKEEIERKEKENEKKGTIKKIALKNNLCVPLLSEGTPSASAPSSSQPSLTTRLSSSAVPFPTYHKNVISAEPSALFADLSDDFSNNNLNSRFSYSPISHPQSSVPIPNTSPSPSPFSASPIKASMATSVFSGVNYCDDGSVDGMLDDTSNSPNRKDSEFLRFFNAVYSANQVALEECLVLVKQKLK